MQVCLIIKGSDPFILQEFRRGLVGVELICIKDDYQNLSVVVSKRNNKIYTDIHLFLLIFGF